MTLNQQEMWNQNHAAGSLIQYVGKPNSLAQQLESMLLPKSFVLEMGCGVGNDSEFFGEQGHIVTATDFSEIAVRQNQKRGVSPNVKFEVLDMSERLPYDDSTFQAVYARLSLHYFSDAITKQIVAEIARVLATNGVVAFVCKSTKDPLYGEGEALGPDTFVRQGHVRHFFSPEYCRELMNGHFEVVQLEEYAEVYANKPSAFVSCIARKN